jgi:hypothetical protein
MVEQKKYQDITRLGHKTTIGVLNEGDHIVIQEKIDGANASFCRGEFGEILAFSRNHQLSEENNLGGFYQFIQSKLLELEAINDHCIFFGEWTNPHKVKYPEHQKQFFLYDIFDTRTGEYLPFEQVEDASNFLDLNLVPVFYKGEYKGFDHLMSFVGRTDLGGMLGDIPQGEGIVVKNIDYKDRFGNQKFVKLVTDKFAEVQKQKAPKDPQVEQTQESVFVGQTVTDARVEKFLHKFVDEGILDEHFGIEDMGTILRNMNPRITEDILKEERDMLPEEYDAKQLSKAVARKVALTVKKILGNR